MRKIPPIAHILLLAVSCLFLFSCSIQIRDSVKSSERMRGVYHRVKPGETLWRISKAYNVDLQELAEINNITDASRIGAGGVVFIPDAREVIDIPAVKPTAETRPATVRAPEKTVTANAEPEKVRADDGAAAATSVSASGVHGKVREETITDRAPALKTGRSPVPAKTPEKAVPRAAGTPESANAGKTQVAVKTPESVPPVKPRETGFKERTAAAPPAKKPEPLSRIEEPRDQIRVDKGRFLWPVKGPVITRFGIQPSGMKYNGIKIAAKEGTPVHAAAAGTVIYASHVKGYGDTIIVKHDESFTTVYAYLKGSTAKRDDRVKKGEAFASVGPSVEPGGEPHLYFEIREKNKARNPQFFLP